MFQFSLKTYVFLLIALTLVFAAPAGASDGELCDSARASAIDATYRNFGELSAEGECFTTDVPAAGTLMLEVGVPADSVSEPRIDFLGRRCDGAKNGDGAKSGEPFEYWSRIANSLLVDVHEPGRYVVCVAAQDPRRSLGEFRLASGFAPADLTKEHTDEHQVEPDPFAGCSGSARGGSRTAFALKEHTDEHQVEPDPFAATPGPSSCELQKMCRRNRTDDHGDVSWCATPVQPGQDVTAEIRNDWGDDSDYFTFVVEELASVSIETTQGSDTFGTLYDRNGYRLSTGGGDGLRQGFRMVKTLSPGRYFVRVEGQGGAEGAYGLEVEILDHAH